MSNLKRLDYLEKVVAQLCEIVLYLGMESAWVQGKADLLKEAIDKLKGKFESDE